MSTGDYYRTYTQPEEDEQFFDLSAQRSIQVLRRYTARPFAAALDVGCGNGYKSARLKQAFRIPEMHGIEISDPLREAAARQIDVVHRLDLDQDRWPLAEASFDLVTAFHVLEHVFYLDRIVGEMRRVLRPGGVLLVDVPNVAYLPERLRLLCGRELKWIGTGKHIRAFNLHNLRRLLRRHGFARDRYYGSVLPVPGTHLRLRVPIVPDLLPNACWSIVGLGTKA